MPRRRMIPTTAGHRPKPTSGTPQDQAEPSIHTTLDEIAATGAIGVLLVPLAIPADRYLVAWIAKAVANWHETRTANGVEVRIADGLTGPPE